MTRSEMDPIFVTPRDLPSGDNCNFGVSETEIPSPPDVLSRAECDGIDTSRTFRPDPVRFPELGLIVKWGEDVTIAEGQCLWFLRKHLRQEVPVPAVYGWRKHNGLTFLYLELVSGTPMASLWDDLAEQDRLAICEQLRGMIRSWRRIKQAPEAPGLFQRLFTAAANLFGIEAFAQPSPPSRLSAINGEGLRDIMFSDAGVYPAGPFCSIQEFHDAFANLLARNKSDIEENRRQEYPELAGLTDEVPVAFTHADLDMSNILLSNPKDGPVRVVAIIDWHQSGWYPEPWEWLKAQSVAEHSSDWKEKYLAMVLDPAPYEYFYAWEYISMSIL